MLVQINNNGYFQNIDAIVEKEYPALKGTTYLDHAGTTPYARLLVERIATDLSNNLFGNPHSASESSLLSSRRIDDVRLQVLLLLNASPDDFDVVFVANATAAIKLVAEAFSDAGSGFDYAYHREAHTSLAGVRELARSSHCFQDGGSVHAWTRSLERRSDLDSYCPLLLGIPAQSNMTGSRCSLQWCNRLGKQLKDQGQQVLTLLDAASHLSTSTLNFGDSNQCPDFTAVSFYKIFGLPDLGALVVRKQSADILLRKRYFGGGTVDMVGIDESWSVRKLDSIHAALEEGTVAFHSIIALGHAIDVHREIYGGMENIAAHTSFVTEHARTRLRALAHMNKKRLCRIYEPSSTSSSTGRGSIIAFNMSDSTGRWVPTSEVQKLAIVRGIQLRVGGLCNPGGISSHLGLSDRELRQYHAAGKVCGVEDSFFGDLAKPSGVIRISFGAMSRMQDIDNLIAFLTEFFVDPSIPQTPSTPPPESDNARFYLDSITVFPIKSGGMFQVPATISWKVLVHGLEFDREWCLVHAGTQQILNQKKAPQMTRLVPMIDLGDRRLTITAPDLIGPNTSTSVNLDIDPGDFLDDTIERPSAVCRGNITYRLYKAPQVHQFFSNALGMPCQLARFDRTRSSTDRGAQRTRPLSTTPTAPLSPIWASESFSNESPLLLVSKSSVQRLNQQIQENNHDAEAGKIISTESFRGNLVIAEVESEHPSPYAEDHWSRLTLGNASFDILGPCQRCQMVCIDQRHGTKGKEPLTTLAKTRRKNGRIWFGMHMALSRDTGNDSGPESAASVQVGDRICAS